MEASIPVEPKRREVSSPDHLPIRLSWWGWRFLRCWCCCPAPVGRSAHPNIYTDCHQK